MHSSQERPPFGVRVGGTCGEPNSEPAIIHRLQNRMSPTSSLAMLSIFYTTAVFIRPVHGSNVTVSLEKQDDMGLSVSHVNSDQLHSSRSQGPGML
jgi:hypothetical protein